MTISIIKFRSHCAEFDQTIKVSVPESKYSSLIFIETKQFLKKKCSQRKPLFSDF